MKRYIFLLFGTVAFIFILTGCEKFLDEPAENRAFTELTDYTKSSDMIKPLIGTYSELNNTEWEDNPLICRRAG